MKIKHFVRLKNSEGNQIYSVKKRSFNDETFKYVRGVDEPFSFYTIFCNSKSFADGKKLNLESGEEFPYDYALTDEDIEVFGDIEKKYAEGLLGEHYDSSVAVINSEELEEKFYVNYKKADLINEKGEILFHGQFVGTGLTKKEIDDFCSAIEVTHAQKPYLDYDEIVKELLGSGDGDYYAKNYEILSQILKKVEKFKTMKGEPTQLTIDMLGKN